MCRCCFPVATMNIEEYDGEDEVYQTYFYWCVNDTVDLNLVYKDGKWFEKRGKYEPVRAWISNWVSDKWDEENKKNPSVDEGKSGA